MGVELLGLPRLLSSKLGSLERTSRGLDLMNEPPKVRLLAS